jgi:hypothetical protein
MGTEHWDDKTGYLYIAYMKKAATMRMIAEGKNLYHLAETCFNELRHAISK